MEMEKQQQRFFKIIGIDTETAWRVYQVPPIDIYIDEQCVKCVERMLEDPDHPITLKTSKKGRENTRSSSFVPSRCNTKHYNNSTLQKTVRTIRDGNCKNKYTAPTRPEDKTTNYIVETIQRKRNMTKKSHNTNSNNKNNDNNSKNKGNKNCNNNMR